MRTGISKKGKEMRKQEKLHRSKVSSDAFAPLLSKSVASRGGICKLAAWRTYYAVCTSPRYWCRLFFVGDCCAVCVALTIPPLASSSVALLLQRLGAVDTTTATDCRPLFDPLQSVSFSDVNLLLCHDHALDDSTTPSDDGTS